MDKVTYNRSTRFAPVHPGTLHSRRNPPRPLVVRLARALADRTPSALGDVAAAEERHGSQSDQRVRLVHIRPALPKRLDHPDQVLAMTAVRQEFLGTGKVALGPDHQDHLGTAGIVVAAVAAVAVGGIHQAAGKGRRCKGRGLAGWEDYLATPEWFLDFEQAGHVFYSTLLSILPGRNNEAARNHLRAELTRGSSCHCVRVGLCAPVCNQPFVVFCGQDEGA